MENFNIYKIPEMEDVELCKLVNGLQDVFKKNSNNFALQCFYVYKICLYYDELQNNTGKAYLKAKDTLYYSARTLLERFGLNEKTISRLRRCYLAYCHGTLPTSVCLYNWAEEFTPSKLFEMLILESRYVMSLISEKIIRPDMTVKEIRKIIKQLRGEKEDEKLKKEEIDESKIPMAYDPTKKYDFEYFKKQTKPALINMICALQDAYQKLKSKKK